MWGGDQFWTVGGKEKFAKNSFVAGSYARYIDSGLIFKNAKN
jgi:hypothetical protein